MNQLIKPLILSISLFGFAASYNQAWSQQVVENDRDKPIEIEANHMQADEQSGISTYTGDVIAVQGSLKIIGDVVEITHPNNQLHKLVATGKLAQFESFLPKQNSWVKGRALKIVYHAEAQKVELLGDAYAEQENKHQINGDKIIYDLETQILGASSEQSNKRVKMVLTPEKTAEKTPEQDTTNNLEQAE